MKAAQIRVDPARLLVVDYIQNRDDGRETSVVAILCRYVPVRRALVAVELLWDPLEQQPLAPYYATRAHLRRELIRPSWLVQVRPY